MSFEHVTIWASGPWIMLECEFVVEAHCKKCDRFSTTDSCVIKPMRTLSVRCRECDEVSAKIHIEKYQIYSESLYDNNIRVGKIVVR